MSAHFRGQSGVVELEAEFDVDIEVEPEVVEPEVIEREAHDPLYPVALLKVAMRLRRLDDGGVQQFEAILDDVLRDMTIDREAFGRYLAKNRGRLMTAVRSRGY